MSVQLASRIQPCALAGASGLYLWKGMGESDTILTQPIGQVLVLSCRLANSIRASRSDFSLRGPLTGRGFRVMIVDGIGKANWRTNLPILFFMMLLLHI